MKALTIWQPWASLIAIGVKTVETRGWSTEYRGRLAIHAAGRPMDSQTLAWAREELIRTCGWDHDRAQLWLVTLELGHVVAIGDLVDVRPAGMVLNDRPGQEPWGNFDDGRWGFELADVGRLDVPQFARGHQGLWDWRDQ